MGLLKGFRNRLTSNGEIYSSRDFAADQYGARQRELSRQLTGLVDVVYALVLVEGAVAFSPLFVRSDEFLHPERFLPVIMALVLIYFTAIHSFIDYHLSVEDQPYQILDTGKRKVDLLRFYLDIVIVGMYSFLLIKSHVLLASPGQSVKGVFFALPVIFALFMVWGALRQRAGDRDSYAQGLLCLFFFLFLALAVVYCLLPITWTINAVALFAAFVLMLFYRWMNWPQNRSVGPRGEAGASDSGTA